MYMYLEHQSTHLYDLEPLVVIVLVHQSTLVDGIHQGHMTPGCLHHAGILQVYNIWLHVSITSTHYVLKHQIQNHRYNLT